MSENFPSQASPYLVIARRYRPQRFNEVIGQDPTVTTLKHALQSKRIAHAYLFAGSRGTGKTSLARLFAKALNCPNLSSSFEPCNACPSCLEITEGRSLDVQEIDGASHRGIDHIRSLTEATLYAPAKGAYKVFIIDEVHMLTKEAFNALLKTLEEPPQFIKFFLATTEAHKIPQTILSRCQRFNLRRLSEEAICCKLEAIVQDMGMPADAVALRRLSTYADGGLRDAESLLEQLIAFSDGRITLEAVEEVLGIAPLHWFQKLDQAIEVADIVTAYSIADSVFFEGKDICHFIDDLCRHYRAQLHGALKASQGNGNAFISPQEYLLEILGALAEAQKTIRSASSQRFLLEWLLTTIVRVRRKIPLPAIVKKLFELQQRLGAPLPQGQSRPQEAEAVRPTTPLLQDTKPVQRKELQATSPPPKEITEILPQPGPRSAKEVAPAIDEQPKAATAPPQPSKRPLEARPPAAGLPEGSLTQEQQKALHENLIQFAAVELGATISSSTKKT